MPEYDPPAGPPPPSYTVSEPASTPLSTPQPAHVQPKPGAYNQDSYNGGYAQPNDYPPQEPQQGGYYAPNPQMGYAQQQGPPNGGYYGQPGPGPYGPQGSYGPGPGYGGGYGYGRPQGQYLDDRHGSSGFTEALLASLACCCCLDACLLF